MKNYDVIIVGGGPGGTVAGRYAAEKGLKTLILERGRTPGDKNVSGCGLSPKCWRDLPFMKEMKLPNMRVADMATVHLVDERNKEVMNMSFTASECGGYKEAREFLTVNVYRSEFDPWLAELAVNAGAEVRTSTLVKGVTKDDKGKVSGVVLEDGTKLNSQIVIGADGIISFTAISAGLRNRWEDYESAVIVQYDYGAPRERIDDVIGSNALHYWYSAIFPVAYTFFSANGFHAGLGCYIEWWPKSPRYYLDKFLQVEGVKRQIKLTGGKPREYQARMLPFLAYPRDTYTDGLMLVGDAAGFACPIEAEGVYYAMMSGRMAGEVAAEAISKGDTSAAALKEYETRWKNSPVGDEFEAGPEVAKFLKDIAFNPEAGKWIVPMLNDLMFMVCNVSDAHIANFRRAEEVSLKYAPDLYRALVEDILPITAVADRPDAKPLPKPLAYLGKAMGSLVLPPIAQKIGAQGNRHSAEIAPFILRNFVAPMVKARMAQKKGGK
jgi:electron transfer flavoprotein-quinone oxidoreductase